MPRSRVADKPTKRTSFHFPEDATPHVFAIAGRTWLDGPASVIRAALSAYGDLVALTSAGYRVVVRTRDGQEKPYSPHCRFNGSGATNTQTEGGEDSDRLPKNFFFPAEVTAKITA